MALLGRLTFLWLGTLPLSYRIGFLRACVHTMATCFACGLNDGRSERLQCALKSHPLSDLGAAKLPVGCVLPWQFLRASV